MSNLRHWLWLSTRGPAPGMYAARVLEHFGTPEGAYYADSAAYGQIPGIPGTVRQALEDKDLTPAETILAKCKEQGIWILTMQDAAYPQHICRAVLSNLYMTKDDMFKPVSVLSGGEKVKTALAKVLVSGCNFMILDEPTNHMDVYTMEGLEHLLESYDGTLLAISHDRTFISHTGDVVFRLEHGDIQKSTEQ